MKTASAKTLLVAIAGALLFTCSLPAQERIEDKQLTQYAFILGFTSTQEKDVPVKVLPDAVKASAIHLDDQIAVLIPDQQLAEDRLAKVSEKEVTPLGQIWLRDLVPQVEGKKVAADKLRSVTIDAGKEKITAQLCFLGLQKNSKGETEVVVYGKGKEVVARPVLEAHEEKHDKPILVGMDAPADKPMTVSISFFGKHRAQFEVAAAGK